MRVLKAADARVEDLTFSPDGNAIAAGSQYHGVFLYNLEVLPPAIVRVPGSESYTQGCLTFSADGRTLTWLLPGGGRRSYNRDSLSHFSPLTFAASMRSQRIILSADGLMGLSLHGIPDHRIYSWRLVEDLWVQTGTLSTAAHSVENLTLSQDGQLFAMLTRPALGRGWESNPRKVEVHHSASITLLATGEYPYKYSGSLLFSPDKSVLVGINDMTVLVWNIPNLEPSFEERGDRSLGENPSNLGSPRLVRNTTRKQFTAMAFHPSGRYLYVTSNGDDPGDATVHVFETASWSRVEQYSWQLGNLKSVALSQEGTLAAAGSDKGEIVIWDIDL